MDIFGKTEMKYETQDKTQNSELLPYIFLNV